MKRTISLFLLIAMLISVLCVNTVAASGLSLEEEPEVPPTVPRISVTTAAGNGTRLQKSDGYVDATVTITDTDGSVKFNNEAITIKVRGNSTATASIKKKAYNIKFDKKKEVLGLGKGKKWSLLANAFDPTLMRNYTAFEFARTLGLEYTSQMRFVELWLDGSFRGCYLLIVPIDVKEERINLDVKSNDGKKDFLLEEERVRDEDDVTYISVLNDWRLRFAISEPEKPEADKLAQPDKREKYEAQVAYIQSTMDEIMTVIKSGDMEAIADKIDLPSFTRFYLLNEYFKNVDFSHSSVYFYYKNGKLYAGPAWDYDLCMGNTNDQINSDRFTACADPTGLYASGCNIFYTLCKYDWFNDEVKAVYNQYYRDIMQIYVRGGKLDELLNTYGGVFDRNFTETEWDVTKAWSKWHKVPLDTYEENVSFLRDWLRDRNDWLSDYFDISAADAPILGDADSDRDVTSIDGTWIKRMIAKMELPGEFSETASDVDGDGSVTVIDAAFIDRWVALMDVPCQIGLPVAAEAE